MFNTANTTYCIYIYMSFKIEDQGWVESGQIIPKKMKAGIKNGISIIAIPTSEKIQKKTPLH